MSGWLWRRKEGPGEVKEAYEALLRRALKRQEV